MKKKKNPQAYDTYALSEKGKDKKPSPENVEQAKKFVEENQK